MSPVLSRRAVLRGAGALVVSLRLAGARTALAESPGLPDDLSTTPWLDGWIRIDATGAATLFTGKAELGQGVKTALLQVCAEELKLPMDRITLVTADTGRTPDEGYTAASHSMKDSGTAIRHAAAQGRETLRTEAAGLWRVEPASVEVADGVLIGPNGARAGYGEVVSDTLLHVMAKPGVPLTAAADFTVMSQPVQRVDIPAKVTGGPAFIQDLRPEGMLHARVLRQPSDGATLRSLDTGPVEALPGVVGVVRNGNFLAVVAEREWTAIQAMRQLARTLVWDETADLPDETALAEALMTLKAQDSTILDTGPDKGKIGDLPTAAATFFRPYLSHGSIGPSCALALSEPEGLTVWSHSQGVFELRDAIASMLDMPPAKVRCIHAEGAGCYGHNGADDVAADAALIAMAVPGRPIRLQWMREQEHTAAPFGPGMVARIDAATGPDGRVSHWRHEVWSQSHMMRPGPAGTLLAARAKADPAPPAPPVALPQPAGGGDRNALPLYSFGNALVIKHFLPSMPLRGSAMRSLGGYLNVLTIESTMDDLARASGQDPVAFRLRHMRDPRARDVITRAAQEYGWNSRDSRRGIGHGFGFARYKNLEAYCAVAMEVTVDPDTRRPRIGRVVAAVDTGEIINPDGVRNQVEGGIVQAASWTLFERVRFDRRRVTTTDWSSYPILRFQDAPRSVEVHLIDRPGMPFLGAGETSQGPAGAALANAITDATGIRLRATPMTAAAIRDASPA
ncbi:MAG: aldehyde dehydrogenase [Maritimibacter sp.]|nr:aldehyde dehydrogenase [Maritimibacter sp.]